ncbi:hypothetical protein ADIARSV_2454 [Arcticibacter svalbardensis MN12-7]|uniref:YdhG-like domain-containing protein n=1 Tax=Arcticibacter svalbardensis MN12-7 TaxID=1150600 RepID=R9GR97_9SPHI|nr:DUF1801 domain-containing protein [Arcticibacter svalbardensis]EOR94372.1 hypothetical protein ADIARSV_2454 [Arcticibacter svalbardensis MN12-7]
MAEIKTKVTTGSVDRFLNGVTDDNLRWDCYIIANLMEKVTAEPSAMWGTAIVGFDKYHYKYTSGPDGDMCLVRFSPRKSNISLYLMPYDMEKEDLMQKLGKYKAGKGCLYIKKLADVDLSILEILVTRSVVKVKETYPG